MTMHLKPTPVPGQDSLEAIRCAATEKLLGRASSDGLYFWCRRCGALHLLSWQQIDTLRATGKTVVNSAQICYTEQ